MPDLAASHRIAARVEWRGNWPRLPVGASHTVGMADAATLWAAIPFLLVSAFLYATLGRYPDFAAGHPEPVPA